MFRRDVRGPRASDGPCAIACISLDLCQSWGGRREKKGKRKKGKKRRREKKEKCKIKVKERKKIGDTSGEERKVVRQKVGWGMGGARASVGPELLKKPNTPAVSSAERMDTTL